jgi:hypothetical protein
MRYPLIALSLWLGLAGAARAQLSVTIDVPGVEIGVNMSDFPELVLVPGYPVYYDPRADSNYFFYDGLYWVYQGDEWYESSWYDGPWGLVRPERVPLFVLRVPVQYYRQRPAYFSGWREDAPPRWGEHWGRGWEDQRRGWDQWDHRSAPAAAPVPVYQRQYTGSRYPRAPEQQGAIRTQNYRYQPRGAVARDRFAPQGAAGGGRTEPGPQAPGPARSTVQTGHAAPTPQRREPGPAPAHPATSAQPSSPLRQPIAAQPHPAQPAQPKAPAHSPNAAQPVQPAQHAQDPRAGQQGSRSAPQESRRDGRPAARDEGQKRSGAQPSKDEDRRPEHR